jgi:hypothetical protein
VASRCAAHKEDRHVNAPHNIHSTAADTVEQIELEARYCAMNSLIRNGPVLAMEGRESSFNLCSTPGVDGVIAADGSVNDFDHHSSAEHAQLVGNAPSPRNVGGTDQ